MNVDGEFSGELRDFAANAVKNRLIFGRLKNEFFHYRDWEGVTAEEFMGRLEAYLVYYREERIKKSLGWLSPMEYRRKLGYA